MTRPHASVLLATAAFLAAAMPGALRAASAAEAAAGRAIVERLADSVVQVEMVVVFTVVRGDSAQPPSEVKAEINGTVIGPDGLTVLSLGSIDPRVRIPPRRGQSIEEPEYKEVKLRLADGAEIPAKVVLKDEDLDLAFVAPDADAIKGREFTFADLDDPATPEVLGTYYDLARAPKNQQRVPAISLVTIAGIIEKPRQFLLMSDYSPGCPVFDAEGRLLGVSLRYIEAGRSTGFVLLPADSIAEIAPRGAGHP